MKENNNVLFENRYCKIIDIKHEVLYVLRDNETKELYYTVLSQIKGIPITGNLLKSKGFNKFFKTWKYKDIEIYNTVLATMQIYWYKGNRIKYIHELENILNRNN